MAREVALETVPRAEIRPAGALGEHLGGIGDRTAFAHGDDFAAVLVGTHFLVVLGEGQVRARGRIDVEADHVHDVVSRIPRVELGGIGGVEAPDEIGEFVDLDVALEHEAPRGLETFRAVGAPPKPRAAGFVERPPDHGHVGLLQLLKFGRDQIQFLNELLVLGCAIDDDFAHIDQRAFAVVGGGHIEMRVGAVVRAVEHEHVRGERDHAAFLRPLDRALGRALAGPPACAVSVEKKIEATHGRDFLGLGFDVGEIVVPRFRGRIIPCGHLLLAGKDVFSLDPVEQVHRAPNAGLGVGRHGGVERREERRDEDKREKRRQRAARRA